MSLLLVVCCSLLDGLTGVGSNRLNQTLVRLHKSDRSRRNHRQPNAVEDELAFSYRG